MPTNVNSKLHHSPFSCTIVTVTLEDGSVHVGCGGSWCKGTCGRPALVVRTPEGDLKVHGSQVAFGPVLQPFRQPWQGAVIVLPPAAADLKGRLWV